MKNTKLKLFQALPLIVFSASGCGKVINIPYVAAPIKATPARSLTDIRNDQILASASDGQDCLKFISSLPSDWGYGFKSLPEDPANPNGPKVSVFYYTNYHVALAAPPAPPIDPAAAPAAAAKPAVPGAPAPVAPAAVVAVQLPSTPVVFFNGGPSSNSRNSYSLMLRQQALEDTGKTISWVFIDQRGTGCSSAYPQVATQTRQLSSQPASSTSNPTSAPVYDPDLLQRLSHYGSKEIVADAEAIRKDVMKGDLPWIIFGQSYGAEIVHRYVNDAPAGIKSAFAHANVINGDGYVRMRNRIKSQGRVLDLYFAAEGKDDQAILASLYAAPSTPTTAPATPPTASAPATGTATTPPAATSTTPVSSNLLIDQCVQNPDNKTYVCVYQVLNYMASKWLGFSDSWPKIHLWVQQLLNADKTLNTAALINFQKNYLINASNPKNLTGLAGLVLEFADRNVSPLDKFHCLQIANDLGGLSALPLINECLPVLHNPKAATYDTLLSVQALHKNPVMLDSFATQLHANANLAFYLYSGMKDCYVPIENFDEETGKITGMSNVHIHAPFESSGHDGFYSESQVWKDLIAEIKR